jgi:poly(A) polymerase
MTAGRTEDATATAGTHGPDSHGVLRVLRACREVGETGQPLDAPLLAALSSLALDPRRVPKGATPEDLLSAVTSSHPIVTIDTMAKTGVLARLLPEVETLRHMPVGMGRHKDVYQHTLKVVAQAPADPITRLAALMHDVGKPATKVVEGGAVHFPGHAELGAEMTRRRLRALGFDRTINEAVTLLVALHLRVNSYESEWTDAAARRLAREAGDQFGRLLDLSRADVTSARREAVERAFRRVDALEQRVEALRVAEAKPESPLDGTELMELFGRPPGRWIGEVKSRLAAMVGAGDLAPDDKDGATAIAHGLVEALTAEP